MKLADFGFPTPSDPFKKEHELITVNKDIPSSPNKI